MRSPRTRDARPVSWIRWPEASSHDPTINAYALPAGGRIRAQHEASVGRRRSASRKPFGASNTTRMMIPPIAPVCQLSRWLQVNVCSSSTKNAPTTGPDRGHVPAPTDRSVGGPPRRLPKGCRTSGAPFNFDDPYPCLMAHANPASLAIVITPRYHERTKQLATDHGRHDVAGIRERKWKTFCCGSVESPGSRAYFSAPGPLLRAFGERTSPAAFRSARCCWSESPASSSRASVCCS